VNEATRTGAADVTIRRGRDADATAIADVFIAARRPMLAYLPDLHDETDIRNWIATVMVPSHEVWVAELDGRLVGFLALHEDLLGHLYVHPSEQNRGIGSALLEHAKALRRHGLHLYVFQQNDGARRLYERHGFRVGELGDGSGNEENVPDALYGWP
jgi:ribosomal protein S18 acetylase RimI-like enzyme